uniref:Helicase C-terminal domain-containing protein n=1 Tax=Arcella intermedia TaxID=1963864 RepID=A0A6B2LGF8_9EUKA
MTKVLDILEIFLDSKGFNYLRLDGSTQVAARQPLIDEFNRNMDIFIFLLTTTAGGVGINLTSADTVIFYDISFNPQVDRQAEDRCHRLGQTKQVQVYKLVVEDSCEEAIFAMAEEKKQLNDIILQEGDYKNSSAEDTNVAQFLGNMFVHTTRKPKKKVQNTKGAQKPKTPPQKATKPKPKPTNTKPTNKRPPSDPEKSTPPKRTQPKRNPKKEEKQQDEEIQQPPKRKSSKRQPPT